VIDEESRRRTQERPAAKEALKRLVRLILQSFVATIPLKAGAALAARLKTKKGQKEFEQAWPTIVDAYLHALRKPRR
jgi:hypothetical protein